jgi:tetratricopeptide (TPR) repeat protein
VESGSPTIRALYRKHISNEEICRAFDLTVRFGIMARAYFIYGAPQETEATIAESLDLIRRIRPLSAIFYILDLFPGTELYEEYKRRTGVTDDIWLDRVEDILYYETDKTLNKERVLEFGRRLREGYFAMLPDFAAAIELEDDSALFPLHADFLSRLALTFSHGDYAANPAIGNHLPTAIQLFERALSYHPDHRAFWGLGLVNQQMQQWETSVAILLRGIDHYSGSADLRMTLASSLIRLGRPYEAREHLLPVGNHPRVMEMLVHCCRLLKDHQGEKTWLDRLKADVKSP